MWNAHGECGPVVSLNRRDGFKPLWRRPPKPDTVCRAQFPLGLRSESFLVTPDASLMQGRHSYAPILPGTLIGARDTFSNDGYLSHEMCDVYPPEFIVCVFFVPGMYAPENLSAPHRDTERSTVGCGTNTGLPPARGQVKGVPGGPPASATPPATCPARRRSGLKPGRKSWRPGAFSARSGSPTTNGTR